MAEYWYQQAVIYALDVETFQDSNGDGIGDFRGLISRLDYLTQLGVNCLWVLPFYVTPNRDNGYDVADHCSIKAEVGTLADFIEFVRQASEKGLRVVIDLVANHTSIDHPWFRAARSDPESPYRDYYVWAKDPPAESWDEQTIFPGVEPNVWTYDAEAKAFYYHKFYHHEPDLNVSNPAVQREIFRIMDYWLGMGISGFRVDAAPHMIEKKGIESAKVSHPNAFLESLRNHLSSRNPEAVLIAETDVKPDKVKRYFGNGNRMHLLFNFLLNNNLFLALARQQAQPLIDRLRELPVPPPGAQWANFIRNLDELDLEQLSESDQQEVFSVFAPEPYMQVYGRGIRRRLAPMLNDNKRWLKLSFSLLFSFPGTPVLIYGDEIGMGEDLLLPERNSVRTTMQWSGEKNGGFSEAAPQYLRYRSISEGEFGFRKVNVANQLTDPQSLLSWIRQAVKLRRQFSELGSGKWTVLELQVSTVLGHCLQLEDTKLVAMHNLSDQPCRFRLELLARDHSFQEVFGDEPYHDQPYAEGEISLNAFGFRWFRSVIN